MKQLFAKYLPIEGKIEKGDKALDKSDNKIITVTDIYDIESVNSVCQKVQLFLCSRDVFPGDDIWTSATAKRTMKLPETAREYLEEIKRRNVGFFKAMGPISPDATWVKEDDEFDKEEVWKNMVCPECLDHDHTGQCMCYSEKYIPVFRNYSIKGPCGHFH